MFTTISIQKLWKWLFVATATLSIALVCSPLRAQDTRILRGVVLDEKKAPIAGTTVAVKTTNFITSTGEDGKFSLSVPPGKYILVFSNVGKVTQEVSIRNQNSVIVTLKDSITGLDDVIVVRYGRQ